MRKVFHFDVPRGQYTADAVVVMCFDLRFNQSVHKFLKRIGVPNYDLIKVAGGAKCLASPDNEAEREFVLAQIQKSIQLHRTPRVILTVHSECGAYESVKPLHGYEGGEASHHEAELQVAAKLLRKVIPEVKVEGYFVDFEGVWQVDVEAAHPIAS